MSPAPDLPTGYYLDNFLILLRFVDSNYSDILGSEEKEFLREFPSLPMDAQRLFVRLISRKGPVFRSDKLRYKEISDIHEAAQTLALHGYLAVDDAVSAEEELSLLGKEELLRIFGKALPELRKMKKPSAVDYVAARLDPLLIRESTRELFLIYSPMKVREIRTFHLLFFGNLYQDLTEFVLSDLGLVRYEPYVISREERLYQTLGQVKTSLQLSDTESLLHQAMEEKDSRSLAALVESLPAAEEDPLLSQRQDRILSLAGRSFERWGELDAAMRCYRRSSSSRERQARILAGEGHLREAWEICRVVLEDPYDEDEKEFAERFQRRLNHGFEPSSRMRHGRKKSSGHMTRSPARPIILFTGRKPHEMCWNTPLPRSTGSM